MKNRNAIVRFILASTIFFIIVTQYGVLWNTSSTMTFGDGNIDSVILPATTIHELNTDILPSTASSTSGARNGTRSVPPVLAANNSDKNKHSRPHPHAGARDANGVWGYIADVYGVRRFITARYEAFKNTTFSHTDLESHLFLRDEREFETTCNARPREGKERKAGWRLLTQKVQVGGPDPEPIEDSVLQKTLDTLSRNRSTTSRGINRTTPRILCAVYTYEKRQEMATAVAETWGWKCDGFFAASTKTVSIPYDLSSMEPTTNLSSSYYAEGLGSVDLPHLGPERYDNMWQKTRSILSYMHDHYLDQFDFFFLSGDDTYVIVENLRRMIQYLGDVAWNDPLHLGHWIPYGSDGSYFCGGGPWYVLNRRILEILIRDVHSSEDRVLGQCLKNTVGIMGNHSVDAMNAQRFHGMDPHDTCTMKGESGFFGNLYQFWGKIYGFRTGFNLTSSQSVSFHHLGTARHLKRIHAILYKSCPPNKILGDILPLHPNMENLTQSI